MLCLAIGQLRIGSGVLCPIASVRICGRIGVTQKHKSDMPVLRPLAENTVRLEWLNERIGLLPTDDGSNS